MRGFWDRFSGRQLTTVVVAVCTTLVLAPGAVWAVAKFSNVAVQDPVSGVKAHVDARHQLLVGDGSGPLTVDGSAVQTLPSIQKHPFHTETFLQNFNTSGFVAASTPTGATIALTDLTITSRSSNTDPWEAFLYEAEGATTTDCVNSMTDPSLFARIAARSAPPGASSVDAFTTPIVLRPLHAGKSWCIVYGAAPSTTTNPNVGMVMDYSGFVVTGTFNSASASASATGPASRSAAHP